MGTLQKPRDPYRGAIESQTLKGSRPDIVHEPEARRLRRIIEGNAGTGGGGGPHAADHENGGPDEIDVTDLSGVLASGQRAAILVNATGEVLIAAAAAPTAGQVLRAIDPTNAEWADASLPGAHAEEHENGGGDEISVEGLSGLLADAQTPLAHTHEIADLTDFPLIVPTSYAQGTFTVTNGNFRIISRHLVLTTTQRATLGGNATLRIT